MSDALAKLARSLAGPFAFCGIGLSTLQGDDFYTATASGIAADEHSYWRAASISKLVTGSAAKQVLTETGKLDQSVEDLLGFSFRAPDGTAPTPAQLASHQAGVTDKGGYLIPDEMTLQDWLREKGATIWSGAAPGAQFEYSNLGFILLAACIERAADEGFDALTMRKVLQPKGIKAGFNWSGLSGQPRILPTYRRSASGVFTAQIDTARSPELPSRSNPYVAGTKPGAYSPQGGLRISLAQLMRLGQSLKTHPTNAGWESDPERTLGPTDLFQSYAWGAQIFHDPSFYPRPLIGHFANAYGFCGGVWWDAQKQASFGYALNGLLDGDDDDGLRPEEREIFATVAQAL